MVSPRCRCLGRRAVDRAVRIYKLAAEIREALEQLGVLLLLLGHVRASRAALSHAVGYLQCGVGRRVGVRGRAVCRRRGVLRGRFQLSGLGRAGALGGGAPLLRIHASALGGLARGFVGGALLLGGGARSLGLLHLRVERGYVGELRPQVGNDRLHRVHVRPGHGARRARGGEDVHEDVLGGRVQPRRVAHAHVADLEQPGDAERRRVDGHGGHVVADARELLLHVGVVGLRGHEVHLAASQGRLLVSVVDGGLQDLRAVALVHRYDRRRYVRLLEVERDLVRCHASLLLFGFDGPRCVAGLHAVYPAYLLVCQRREVHGVRFASFHVHDGHGA